MIVIAVHVDAVLELPYYTISLPDNTRKHTNYNNLMTLSDYKKKMASLGRMDREDNRRGRLAENEEEDLDSSWSFTRTLSNLRSSSRGRSRSLSKPRSGSAVGDRSSSRRRQSRTGSCRSPSHDDEDRSHSSRRSSRSNSSRRSSKDTRQGRPRSPSPFSKRSYVQM